MWWWQWLRNINTYGYHQLTKKTKGNKNLRNWINPLLLRWRGLFVAPGCCIPFRRECPCNFFWCVGVTCMLWFTCTKTHGAQGTFSWVYDVNAPLTTNSDVSGENHHPPYSVRPTCKQLNFYNQQTYLQRLVSVALCYPAHNLVF